MDNWTDPFRLTQHQNRNTFGTYKTSVAWKYDDATGLMIEKKHITNLSGYESNPDSTAKQKGSALTL